MNCNANSTATYCNFPSLPRECNYVRAYYFRRQRACLLPQDARKAGRAADRQSFRPEVSIDIALTWSNIVWYKL